MLTFDQSGKGDLIAKLEAHAKADAFVQRTYFDHGKGCAVGCTLVDYGVDPSDHAQYEKLFGVPEVLARIEDCIFEGLRIEDAKEWALRFANAIPPKTDLIGVYPKFQQFILVDPENGVIRFSETDEQRQVIQDCAALFNDYPNIDREQAKAVKDAAAAAAAAAAYAAAAAAAADAAAYAAAAADAAAAAAYAAAYAAADAADAADAAAAAAADAAAYAAADAADAADADAAYAAADAADAADADAAADARQSHYKIMADKLISLIEAA